MSDRSLCAGRLGPADPTCADRTRCQRYIDLLATHGDAIPVEIWVASKMHMSDAQDREVQRLRDRLKTLEDEVSELRAYKAAGYEIRSEP